MTASSDGKDSPAAPRIPDYTLLKRIGGGSYGDVWLARSLTGAFRAVKIVRRERFEHEEVFEREFHGVRNYEKVSRSHSGLLDVLHVGRLESPELYYYVMELAEPFGAAAASESAWEDYVPHTLALTLKSRKPISPHRCAEIGAHLADALAALHRNGLIHRDIKPSNIVFIAGRPKLADLGLVAVDGQRTYVGTPGYLAPEGPGSPQGDIYSLGKVLYEMSTGRDRLDFPRVPEGLESLPEKETWRQLNAVICKACDPQPRQRHTSAEALREDLAGLGKESPGFPWKGPALAALAFVLAAAGAFLVFSRRSSAPPPSFPNPAPAQTPEPGSVKVISDPPGALVYGGDRFLGATPLVLAEMPPGPIELHLVKAGYRTVKLKARVRSGGQILLGGELSVWRPPIPGELWENGLGMRFVPSGRAHLSAEPVKASAWQKLLQETPGQTAGDPIAVNGAEAERFCKALTARERSAGYLSPVQRYRPAGPADFAASQPPVAPTVIADAAAPAPFHIIAETLPHGTLVVASEPEGATVTCDGRIVGTTPLTLEDLPSGPMEILLEKDGYEPAVLKGNLVPDRTLDLTATLRRSRLLVFGVPWENSLGMRFVPLGENLMVAIWETRLRDYAAFAGAKGSGIPAADFPQTENDPVVLVNRPDAVSFCEWLTTEERQKGVLPPGAAYRLPTDAEWSLAAGLAGEPGHSPATRDGLTKGIFPWGNQWPPPAATGNFADATLTKGKRDVRSIPGYADGFAQSAPVGSFPPNPLGLHDIAGNVWEWVADDYGGPDLFANWAVLRGGSWANEQREVFWTSYRNLVKPTMSEPIFGFRVVIARDPSASPSSPP